VKFIFVLRDGPPAPPVPVRHTVDVGDDGVALVSVWATDADVTGWFRAAPVDGWQVEERVQWAAPFAVKQVSFVHRLPSLARDEFAAHWTDRHTPLARVHHPGVCHYVQNVVLATVTPGAADIDGIAELGFASDDDRRTRYYDSPAGREIIAEDVRRFIDLGAGFRLLVRPTQASGS